MPTPTRNSPFDILRVLFVKELERIDPYSATPGGDTTGVCPLGQALGLKHSPTTTELEGLDPERFGGVLPLRFMCWWDTAVLRESARRKLLLAKLAVLEEKRGLV